MNTKQIIIALLLVLNVITVKAQEEKRYINDYTLVSKNNKLGLVDSYNNVKIPLNNYTKIEYDNIYDLYKCYKGNEFEIYFDNFKKLNTDYLLTKIVDNENDSELIKIKSKKGFGYIYKRNLIIPPIYDKLTYEIETYFGAYVNIILEKDGLFGINLLSNKNILEPEYNKLIKLENSKAFIVTKNNLKGLIYSGYNLYKLPVEYTKIEKVSNDEFSEKEFFLITKNNQTGLYCAKNNQIIIPPIFSKIDLTNLDDYLNTENQYLVTKNGKSGIIELIRKQDSILYKVVIPYIYNKLDITKINEVSSDIYKIPAKHNSDAGYVIWGRNIPKNFPSFVKEINYNENYEVYTLKNTSNKWGIWNNDNKSIDFKYDNILSFDDDKIKVKLNGKEVYVNTKSNN